MIPPIQIGKYEFRVTDVQTCARRTGWLAWLWPGWDVILSGGIRIRLSNEEKAQLDEEMGTHNEIMGVYGFAKTLGFRG
jgi:hypothetical protein